jgi:hypothetical protein
MTVGIGGTRELTPCPKNGKITFKQIGAIREISEEINMDDEVLLPCRRPFPLKDEDGNSVVDETYDKNQVYKQREPTNDPADYYSALWGHNYKLTDGNTEVANPLDEFHPDFDWTFPDKPPYQDGDNLYDSPWRGGSQSVSISDEDTDEPYFRVSASSYSVYTYMGYAGNGTGIYEWVPKVIDSQAWAYIGKVPANQKLFVYFEWNCANSSWYDEPATMEISAWREGYRQGDQKQYFTASIANRGWRSELVEIEVDENFRDLWIGFKQLSSSQGGYGQSCYFRNINIWRA